LTGSIYELLRDGYGLEPTRLRQEVEPTQLDMSAATRFGIRPDVPVLRVTRTAWDAEDRTIEFARICFVGIGCCSFPTRAEPTTTSRKGQRHERF
jgi:DNA-binding GntR family transcriptional regulator